MFDSPEVRVGQVTGGRPVTPKLARSSAGHEVERDDGSLSIVANHAASSSHYPSSTGGEQSDRRLLELNGEPLWQLVPALAVESRHHLVAGHQDGIARVKPRNCAVRDNGGSRVLGATYGRPRDRPSTSARSSSGVTIVKPDCSATRGLSMKCFRSQVTR